MDDLEHVVKKTATRVYQQISPELETLTTISGVRGGGGRPPPPEIPKALQNRAKFNPIVKTVKKLLNLGRHHPKMFGKNTVKF